MNKEVQEFVNLIHLNKEFNLLMINSSKISYQNETINIEEFDMKYFLENNPNFVKDVNNLSAKSIFDILKIHNEVLIKKKINEQKETMTEEDIEKLSEKYPVLKKFHIITQKVTSDNKIDEFREQEYSRDIAKNESINHLHYVDEIGQNHLLYDTTGEELINAYKNLIMKNNRLITEEELYAELKKNKKDIPLECLNEALMNGRRTEKHLNNLKILNDLNHQTGETLDTPLGNEENGIYISHYEVITYSYNKDNEYVKEVHETINGDETNVDNISEEKIEEKDAIQLISFNEYKKLIFKDDELTLEENNMISVFEDFLFDVISYKDYLTPELYDIYLEFERLLNYIYEQKNSEKFESIKERYNNMLDRADAVTLTNVHEKVLVLTRLKNEMNNTGVLSFSLLIIFIVILIGIVLGFILLK